jgi:hypothetical protein
MLPVLVTSAASFASASTALDHLANRTVQRVTVPMRDLSVDEHGRLSHAGAQPISALQGLPLTDGALAHVNRLLGIPRNYAELIDPAFHALSANELLARHLGIITIVIEEDRDREQRRVAAVVRGARASVPHETVLKRLVHLGVDSAVRLHGGLLDVRFGGAELADVLPGDSFTIQGALRNDAWGDDAARKPLLEISVYLLRLICTNGAYLMRDLATGRSLDWSSARQLIEHVDRQIDRVLTVSRTTIQGAVQRMSETTIDLEDLEAARQALTRHAGHETAAELLADAVSVYDLMNAVTGGAKRTKTQAGQRRLEIYGGEILDRFVTPRRAA